MRSIQCDDAPTPVGPYSQAVSHAEWIFASGQLPLDPATGALVEGEIEAQTERVIANLAAVLEAAGSGLDRVVKTTIYVTDLAHFARINAVYARHFGSDGAVAPARATVQVAALPVGAAVEIDAIAITRSAATKDAGSPR